MHRNRVNSRTREVHSSDNADWYTGQYDAKEKGKNEYAGNGGKHRKKKFRKDGVVVTKQHQGFDIKIWEYKGKAVWVY